KEAAQRPAMSAVAARLRPLSESAPPESRMTPPRVEERTTPTAAAGATQTALSLEQPALPPSLRSVRRSRRQSLRRAMPLLIIGVLLAGLFSGLAVKRGLLPRGLINRLRRAPAGAEHAAVSGMAYFTGGTFDMGSTAEEVAAAFAECQRQR